MSNGVEESLYSLEDSESSLIDISESDDISSFLEESNESVDSDIYSTSASEKEGFLVDSKNHYSSYDSYFETITNPSEERVVYDFGNDMRPDMIPCEDRMDWDKHWKCNVCLVCIGLGIYLIFMISLVTFQIQKNLLKKRDSIQHFEGQIDHFGNHEKSFENENVRCSMLYKIDVNSIVSASITAPFEESFTSNLENSDFECTGFCYCDPYERRTSGTLTKRSLKFLVTALSTSIAFHQAKKYFQNECETSMKEELECDLSIIRSEVEKCNRNSLLLQTENNHLYHSNEIKSSLSNSITDILSNLKRTCEESSEGIKMKTIKRAFQELENDDILSGISDRKKKMVSEAAYENLSSQLESQNKDFPKDGFVMVQAMGLCKINKLRLVYKTQDQQSLVAKREDLEKESFKQVSCRSCIHVKDYKKVRDGVLEEQQHKTSNAWKTLLKKCALHLKDFLKDVPSRSSNNFNFLLEETSFSQDFSECIDDTIDECGINRGDVTVFQIKT